MTFTQQTTSCGVVMALQGSFTFKDHHSFRALLDGLKAVTGHEHVLDLSGIDFLDSAALGMLLVADDETKSRGCNLTLRKPSSQIARLLELASMDRYSGLSLDSPGNMTPRTWSVSAVWLTSKVFLQTRPENLPPTQRQSISP